MIHFPWHRRRLFTTLTVAIAAIGLACVWRSAAGDWEEPPTQRTFQIRAEFPLGDETGQQLLQQMAQLKSDVESTLGLPGTDRPIEVSLFKSRDSYLQHLQSRIPAAAERSAMFINSSKIGRIYTICHPDYEQDIRHECTHAVLHSSLHQLPLWLDEGLAEYFELSPAARAHGNPYQSQLQLEVSRGWKPDLQRLEALADINEIHSDDYRECWAWTHWMLHGPAAAQRVLLDFIQSARAGQPACPLSDRLRTCLPDMDVQLIHHLRTW